MKKKCCLVLILVTAVLLLLSSGYADSTTEWIKKYGRSKLIKAVDVVTQTYRYVTTLPAGTYVKRLGTNLDGTIGIEFRYADGSKGSGRVPSDAVGSGCVHYTDPAGTSQATQELEFFDMVENGEINPSVLKFTYVSKYLNDVYDTPYASDKNEEAPSPTATPAPEADDTQEDTPKPAATQKPAATKKPSSSSATRKPSSGKATVKVTATPAPVKSTVTYQGLPAQIDILSSYESEITVGGEKITVLTSELEFESTAKEEERLAVIYAPKTGKATLREKASQNAKMVKNCKAGRYALVLEKGKNFSKIYYNNAVGYLRTDCLKFYPIANEPYAEGILSLNGYTTGNAEINVRNKADYGTHISGTYKTGTVIRVIEIGDTWTEVEIDRIRGYIQTKFLTMPE